MLDDRRFAATTAFALVAHAALVALIAVSPRSAIHLPPERLYDVNVDASMFTLEQPRDAQPARPMAGTTEFGAPLRAKDSGLSSRDHGVLRHGAVPQVTPGQEDATGTEPVAARSGAPTTDQAKQATPRLSLAQLGIGTPGAVPVESSAILRDSERRLSQSRKLERSLRQDATDEALQVGLGPAGPILTELERMVYSSPIADNGWATIRARLLDGGVIEMELLGSSSDRERWSQLVDTARKHLLHKKLVPPQGSRGLDLELRVDSRVQMPSGADPGLDIRLFGLSLKKGEGKRSSKLELLSQLPRFEADEGPLPNGEQKSPRIVLDLFKGGIDPADIGAGRRRVVRARVTRQTVL